MKQNPQNNEAATKFKLLRNKFEKCVKKAKKKIIIDKNLNHVWETQDRLIS